MMMTTDSPRLVADDGGMGPRSDAPRRRAFAAEYKLAVLAEYEAAAMGERGALLRREGLYSSHLVEWRRARDAGALSGSARPAPGNRKSPDQVENERLHREVARLSKELAEKDAALEIVGRAHALLELLSERAPQQPVMPPPGASSSTPSRRS